jgi:hypothetical protein
MRSSVVARAKPHQIVQISPFQPPAIAQMMSVEVVSLFAAAGCLAHPPGTPSYRSADRSPIRRVQVNVAVKPAAANGKNDYQDCKDDKHHKYYSTTQRHTIWADHFIAGLRHAKYHHPARQISHRPACTRAGMDAGPAALLQGVPGRSRVPT